MKLLAALGKGIGGAIFTLALAGIVIAAALGQFTAYDNLKPITVGLIEQGYASFEEPTAETRSVYNLIKGQCDAQGGQGVISIPYGAQQVTVDCADLNGTTEADAGRVVLLSLLKSDCAGKESIELETQALAQFEAEAVTPTLKCADVAAATPQNIVSVVAGSTFDSIYNRPVVGCEGTIGFVTCLQQRMANPPELAQLLLTSRANQFFNGLQTLAFIGVAIGVALLALSIRRVSGVLKSVGVSSIIVGAGYFVTNITRSLLPPVPQEAAALVQPVLDSLLGTMQQMFLYIFVAGIVLTAAGFVLGFAAKTKKKMPEFI